MSKTEKERKQVLLFNDFQGVSKEDWKKEAEKRVSYKDLIWRTEDGMEIEPLYTEEEARDFFPGEAPPPGEFPFVRGTGRKDNRWLLAEDIKLSSIKKTRAAARSAIDGGADSLTLIPQGEIKPGVLETLVKEINPSRIGINFAVGENPEKICALFISSCAREKIDTRKLGGAVFFDPLSHLLGRRAHATPLDENVDKIAETIGYLSDAAPGYAAFSVKSSTFKDSGATITQELAFTIAAAVEYLVMLRQRGVDADSACRHLVFSFSTGSGYFAEIAKLRAARVLWAKVTQQFSPASSESAKMRIHCRTCSFNKTIYDPHTNILRTALEAMASVIGGTDSLTVEPFDAHYREPDGFSRRVARNIQLLARNESHLGAVTDPGGGSYHIEKLTQSISEKSLELFQETERKGGYLECLKSGFIQNAVEDSRKKVLSDVSRRKKTLVGTNEFPDVLEKMAGNIRKTLPAEKETDGSAPAIKPLAESRASQVFEKTRLLSEQYAEETGEAAKVFLLHLSDSPQTAARSVFAMNFFGCGGFAIVDGTESPGVDDGVAAALRENPLAVAICGSDKDYEQFAEEAAAKLKQKKAEIKIVVPGGGKSKRELARAGVDDFIHADSDVLDTLKRYQQLLFSDEVGS